MTNEEAIKWLNVEASYIEADVGNGKEILEAYDMAIESLEQQPKVGVWLKNGELCKCSRCGSNVLFSAVKLYNYCYRCGAKMEVENDNR